MMWARSMKSVIQFTVCLFVLFSVVKVGTILAQNESTTIILVRHAEKVDDSRDPELSEAGKRRAEKLAELLGSQSIDAIYSTDFIRTRDTCAPIASQKRVEVKLYDHRNTEHLDSMISSNTGKTILVCGHSNSTPRLANHFLKQERFAEFDESDYSNILVVTIPSNGTPTVVHFRY